MASVTMIRTGLSPLQRRALAVESPAGDQVLHGDGIVADAEHQWVTVDGADCRAVRTTQVLARTLRSPDGQPHHMVDTAPPACAHRALVVHTAHPVHGGGAVCTAAPLALYPRRPRPRLIVDVRPVPSVPVRCVEVDAVDHLYLAGRSMVPTHNSTLGLDFARSCSVKHGMTSAVFSLEMSKSEIVMRLLSAEARIRLADMRAGRMSDDDWTRMARRMSEISEAPLFIDDSPNLTLMEIRAKARRLKQRNDLKLVILDYLQLMTSGRKVESRQQEVSEFSRQIKLLAKELEVPVVAISQLNRGPEQRTDKRPLISDLRESGSIEQDSDMVILLHRPDAFERADPRAGEADLILAKHRNGPTSIITVAHQLHYSRFTNLASTM